ncbi:MAG TPA: L-2-hydroxyglutarate oxidase [Pirellulaceae bacterium]|nr:L-2-hydroxyglutarate oxidase [Pirellulaceae bacterium]
MSERFDRIVIGGGIVGLAVAAELLRRFPADSVAVLEKESRVAAHQTGRNSGVLHSGIYYRPGSLKARLCRDGKRAMEAFCEQESIPFERCGKVIVALDESELPRLDSILERGLANGVRCERIGRERLQELEPHAAGIAAIHVPEAGIVSYRQVAERLRERIDRASPSRVVLAAPVSAIRSDGPDSIVVSAAGEFRTGQVINCAGLHCDRVSRAGGLPPAARIIPFRGEYYEVAESRRHLCRHLIYPVPDPAFPFLGVHFTRMIDGSVECGPNAVLAFAREGYSLTTLSPRDLAESIGYSGFRRLIARHWRKGFGELWRSISKRAFVRALQRLLPEIRAEDLSVAPAGVRAQAVLPDGGLVDDFLFVERPGMLTVNNAPSPAATASLAIAGEIVARLARTGPANAGAIGERPI